MNLKFRSLILFSVILFSGCASKKFINVHPEYVSLSQGVEKVVILPLEAHMEKLVFTGENEDLSQEAEENSASIVNLIESGIASKSYEVVLLDEALLSEETQDLAFHITQIKDMYSNKKSSMYQRLNPHINTKETESLPVQADTATIQSLNYVAAELDVDAFIIARYYGFRKSSGLVAKELASSVLFGLLTGSVISRPMSGHSLEVGMIEAATGHVLWMDAQSKPQIVIEDLSSVMDSLPVAARSLDNPEQLSEAATDSALAEAI